jgi:hypothetical protein
MRVVRMRCTWLKHAWFRSDAHRTFSSKERVGWLFESVS